MSLGDVYKSRKKLLAQNLQSKGVNASSSEGLTTLINKVLDTPVAVTGIELDTSIALSKDINSPKTHDDVIITAVLKGDYNDESAADIDLSGYLKGANITFKEGNTVLGYATTNANGTATYTVSDITAGTHTFSAIFNGENTDYDTCSETINVVAKDDYHLVFEEESYTATNKAATVTCLLTNNEVPVSGETITFTDSNSLTYTATTNSNGIATLNLNNVSGNITLTASYAEINTTCSILGILFYDNCSSDNTSQYDTLLQVTNNETNVTLTYDSTEQAYSYIGTGGEYFVGKVIPNIRGADNIRIRCKVKFKNTNAYNQFFIIIGDSLWFPPGNTNLDIFRILGDGRVDYLHNSVSSSVYSASINTNYITQNYCYIELIKQGTSIIGNTYDNNMNLLTTTSQNCSDYTNPYFAIGLNARYNNAEYGKFIKEIIVEPLNTSFKTPSSLLFEDKATEGNVNTNYIKTNSGINVVTDSNGTTISDSHYGDDCYIANTLIQGDFHAEYCLVNYNAYGEIAFVNTSQTPLWGHTFLNDDQRFFSYGSNTTESVISSTHDINKKIVLERIGNILYIYYDNILLSMQPVSTVDGYIAWKTHSHSNRSITFKNLRIWSLEE